VNWFPSTYEGPIYFVDYSGDGWTEDEDYNWLLDTPNQAGVTTTNTVLNDRRMLQLEFDRTETTNQFTTPWWASFHQAVDRGGSDNQYTEARGLVNGRFAIVTGLIGLDCGHSCASESHPVYAMAIHVNDDPLDDVWAIFVRNWGNEGFCSASDHQFAFQNNMYTFRLPWRPGAQLGNHTDTFNTNNSAVSGPGITALAGKAVLVSFSLPDPAHHPWINGELHLQWVGGSSAMLHPVPDAARSASPVGDEEGPLARITTQMTDAQRVAFFSEAPSTAVLSTQDMRARPYVGPPAGGVPQRIGLESLRVQSVADPVKAEHDRRLQDHLRAVFGGTIPGLPG
jgi:hypothetical protein